MENHFDKILLLFGDRRDQLTVVEVNEYFEYADLSMSLGLQGVDEIKRKLIGELEQSDDINGDFFLQMATLVGMNVERFSEEELNAIATIYKRYIAKLSNPLTVHYVGGVLDHLNVKIDWTGSPFSSR